MLQHFVCSPDASKIFVSIGFGLYAELTLAEALRFIEKKVIHLNTISDVLTKDAIKVKTNIKIVLEVGVDHLHFHKIVSCLRMVGNVEIINITHSSLKL